MRTRALLVVAQLATVAALLRLWEWASDTGRIDPVIFGSPSEAFARLGDWISDGSLPGHVFATLRVLLLGYTLAIVIGVALGALVGLSDLARQILDPFLMFYMGMPRLILYPFLVVWLGFGLLPKVVFVVLVIAVMVAVIVQGGFRDVQGDMVDNMRLLGAGNADLARHVYLPALTGVIVSTSRLTLGKAFAATIFAEFVATTQGLGYLVIVGQQNYNANSVWAALLVVLVVSFLLDSLIGAAADRAKWREPVG